MFLFLVQMRGPCNSLMPVLAQGSHIHSSPALPKRIPHRFHLGTPSCWFYPTDVVAMLNKFLIFSWLCHLNIRQYQYCWTSHRALLSFLVIPTSQCWKHITILFAFFCC